jgi:hypothetical protein
MAETSSVTAATQCPQVMPCTVQTVVLTSALLGAVVLVGWCLSPW